MRALIVDDNYVSRSHLKDLVMKYADCDAVSCGELAIDMFRSAHAENIPYTFITMDVEMPGMCGQEAVRHIREIEAELGIKGSKGVKVIMVSSMEDISSVAKAYVEGCDGYLRKPANDTTVAKALQELEVIEPS